MKKVLLVEDEVIARMVNTRLLQQLGYTPDVAENGEDAVLMSQAGYDVILMDIGLPGIDGLEATRQIRASETTQGRRARMVALTAYSIESYRDKCDEAGLDVIVNKPITIEKLSALIEAAA